MPVVWILQNTGAGVIVSALSSGAGVGCISAGLPVFCCAESADTARHVRCSVVPVCFDVLAPVCRCVLFVCMYWCV